MSKWIDIVNQNYPVEFYNGQTQQQENRIDKLVVFNYWNGKTDLINDATIKLRSIVIKCHFFTGQEIENDVDSREIVTIDNHNILIDYLKTVSEALDKKIILTAENQPESVYVEVTRGNIKSRQVNLQPSLVSPQAEDQELTHSPFTNR